MIREGNFTIIKTLSADTPIAHGERLLLTVDMWESAYDLDYQYRRGDYPDVFTNHLVIWEFVNSHLA